MAERGMVGNEIRDPPSPKAVSFEAGRFWLSGVEGYEDLKRGVPFMAYSCGETSDNTVQMDTQSHYCKSAILVSGTS